MKKPLAIFIYVSTTVGCISIQSSTDFVNFPIYDLTFQDFNFRDIFPNFKFYQLDIPVFKHMEGLSWPKEFYDSSWPRIPREFDSSSFHYDVLAGNFKNYANNLQSFNPYNYFNPFSRIGKVFIGVFILAGGFLLYLCICFLVFLVGRFTELSSSCGAEFLKYNCTYSSTSSYKDRSYNKNTSNNRKRKVSGSDGSDEDDNNGGKKPKKDHELDDDSPLLVYLAQLIELKKLIDTIRRVRHRLLAGAANSSLYDSELVERIRNIGSRFADSHLNKHIDGNLYPWLNSYINNHTNVTIMDGASLSRYEATDIIQAEEALYELDALSDQLETLISNIDPTHEFSDDTDSDAIDQSLNDIDNL